MTFLYIIFFIWMFAYCVKKQQRINAIKRLRQDTYEMQSDLLADYQSKISAMIANNQEYGGIFDDHVKSEQFNLNRILRYCKTNTRACARCGRDNKQLQEQLNDWHELLASYRAFYLGYSENVNINEIVYYEDRIDDRAR